MGYTYPGGYVLQKREFMSLAVWSTYLCRGIISVFRVVGREIEYRQGIHRVVIFYKREKIG
jgi:hypothetical protein